MARDEFGLRLFILVGHLAGIAARAFALDALHVLDEDRLGAEALDLLFRCRAHVGGGNLRAQPPLGRDCLQPGAADPRSAEHTSELPSPMRISYALICLTK